MSATVTPSTVPQTARSIRRYAGLSLVRVAGLADVGVTAARVFELDPRAVSESSRRKLTDFYARLRAEIVAA